MLSALGDHHRHRRGWRRRPAPVRADPYARMAARVVSRPDDPRYRGCHRSAVGAAALRLHRPQGDLRMRQGRVQAADDRPISAAVGRWFRKPCGVLLAVTVALVLSPVMSPSTPAAAEAFKFVAIGDMLWDPRFTGSSPTGALPPRAGRSPDPTDPRARYSRKRRHRRPRPRDGSRQRA